MYILYILYILYIYVIYIIYIYIVPQLYSIFLSILDPSHGGDTQKSPCNFVHVFDDRRSSVHEFHIFLSNANECTGNIFDT